MLRRETKQPKNQTLRQAATSWRQQTHDEPLHLKTKRINPQQFRRSNSHLYTRTPNKSNNNENKANQSLWDENGCLIRSKNEIGKSTKKPLLKRSASVNSIHPNIIKNLTHQTTERPPLDTKTHHTIKFTETRVRPITRTRPTRKEQEDSTIRLATRSLPKRERSVQPRRQSSDFQGFINRQNKSIKSHNRKPSPQKEYKIDFSEGTKKLLQKSTSSSVLSHSIYSIKKKEDPSRREQTNQTKKTTPSKNQNSNNNQKINNNTNTNNSNNTTNNTNKNNNRNNKNAVVEGNVRPKIMKRSQNRLQDMDYDMEKVLKEDRRKILIASVRIEDGSMKLPSSARNQNPNESNSKQATNRDLSQSRKSNLSSRRRSASVNSSFSGMNKDSFVPRRYQPDSVYSTRMRIQEKINEMRPIIDADEDEIKYSAAARRNSQKKRNYVPDYIRSFDMIKPDFDDPRRMERRKTMSKALGLNCV
ncbi:hypothetical protein TRFO_15081 [Tritrichomonas foetus]|uniref:Uncharacterized protein n=1 Tax=Tritrichomonas foetus TaxID=1144522 RepID=A0A1J4KXV7_9EUKA|nr:hypothetical protein TRFO_15081 [Tritrichomonas foetus]|eukprot:OHT14542.1 hypothetical protein TRFO_15081 [Tritrichomonas foetus]